jgi:hypothetical protein
MRQYPGYTKYPCTIFLLDANKIQDSFLDDTIKSDTTTLSSPDTVSRSSLTKKKRESDDDNIKAKMKQGAIILKIMEDSAIDSKNNFEKSESNKQKRASFLAKVELVKALDDKAKLGALLEEAEKDGSDNN